MPRSRYDKATGTWVPISEKHRMNAAPPVQLLTVPRGKMCPDAIVFDWDPWTRLLAARDAHDVEVSFFGITAPDDPFRVIDLVMPKQQNSYAFTRMDPDALADLQISLFNRGIPPDRWSRIWIHTHPGPDANPSSTDIDCFCDSFSVSEYAVMVIIGKPSASWNDGNDAAKFQTTARFRLHSGRFFVDRHLAVRYMEPDVDPNWLTHVKENIIPFAQRGQSELIAPSTGASGSDFVESNGSTPLLPGASLTSSNRRAISVDRVPDLEALAEMMYAGDQEHDRTQYQLAYDHYEELPLSEQDYVDDILLIEFRTRVHPNGLLPLLAEHV